MKELFILFVFAFFLISSLESIGQETVPATKQLLVVAHRGASGSAPENTRASFQRAIDLKSEYIELDVHQSKDSVLVVLHDLSVNRTTNGKGKIRELSYDFIASLDAGEKFGLEFKGEKILTLEEVILFVNGKSILFIDLKKGGNYYKGIEDRIVNLIKKHDAHSWCILQTLDKPTLIRIHQLDPAIVIYKSLIGKIPLLPFYIDNRLNTKKILDFPMADGFTVHHKLLTKKLVNKIHARNRKVFAWTANDIKHITNARAKGVDGIITNFPERIIK